LDELKTALPLIPAKTQLLEMEGVGHDLGRNHAAAAAKIVTAALEFNR